MRGRKTSAVVGAGGPRRVRDPHVTWVRPLNLYCTRNGTHYPTHRILYNRFTGTS